MISIRPYQDRAIAALVAVTSGIIWSPAGSGKTVIGAASLARWITKRRAAGDFRWYRILWLANTTEQCAQARAAIALFPEIEANADVLIACYAAQIPCYDFDIVILDECHHCGADTIAASLSGHEGIRWGLSATPEREDERRGDVFRLIGPIVERVHREELLAAGFITPAKVFMHRIGTHSELERQVADSADPEIAIALRRWHNVSDEELKHRIIWRHAQTIGLIENQKRNARVISIAKEHAEDSTLIIVSQVEHGEKLKEHIPNSDIVYSKLGKKKRAKLLADFASGQLRTLIATSLADEGLDVPRANVLIQVAGGRSGRQAEQRTGRVLRTFAGKTHGTIHDFLDLGHCYLRAQSVRREKTYRQLGYEITEA